MGRNLTRYQVSNHDAFRVPVDDDQFEHLGPRIHLDGPQADLPGKRLISPEQELLARLPARVKSARYLRATEGTVGEQSAVFTRERDALGGTLIDDVDADLRQAIDVRFPRTKVAA